MARKSKTADKTFPGADAAKAVECALALANERGWAKVSLADVAQASGLGLAALYDLFEDKRALAAEVARDIDRKVLAEGPADPGSSVRDRLFEVVMRRFDAMAPNKDAILSILRDSRGDPMAWVDGACLLHRSVDWMLEAAGLSSAGWRGRARAKGLAVVYGAVFRVWITDDSEDMAKTMAALDRNLARAERVAAWCGVSEKPDEPPSGEATGEAAQAVP